MLFVDTDCPVLGDDCSRNLTGDQVTSLNQFFWPFVLLRLVSDILQWLTETVCQTVFVILLTVILLNIMLNHIYFTAAFAACTVQSMSMNSIYLQLVTK